MSVTIERAANGWVAYDGDEPHIFVTFAGVIDFLHVRLCAEPARENHYFETCCGTCGANPESD